MDWTAREQRKWEGLVRCWAYDVTNHDQFGIVRAVWRKGIVVEATDGRRVRISYGKAKLGMPPWTEQLTPEQLKSGQRLVREELGLLSNGPPPRRIPVKGISPYGSLHPKRIDPDRVTLSK